MIASVDQELLCRAGALHRELCRGLAIGLQAGRLAVQDLGYADLVVVAESQECALDGIQAVTGATPGNCNLMIHDRGKLAFTFFRVSDGRGIRIAWTAELDPHYQGLRRRVLTGRASAEETARFEALDKAEVGRILEADPATLFRVEAAASPAPAVATVGPWVKCARCDERVMENRTKKVEGEPVCIPCAQATRLAS